MLRSSAEIGCKFHLALSSLSYTDSPNQIDKNQKGRWPWPKDDTFVVVGDIVNKRLREIWSGARRAGGPPMHCLPRIDYHAS
jgi:hypothetical protein